MNRLREDCGVWPEGTWFGFTTIVDEPAIHPMGRRIVPRSSEYQAAIDRALERMEASLRLQNGGDRG